jgi:hypothetical protein
MVKWFLTRPCLQVQARFQSMCMRAYACACILVCACVSFRNSCACTYVHSNRQIDRQTCTQTYQKNAGICQRWKDEAKARSSSSDSGPSRLSGGKSRANTAATKRSMNNIFFEMRKVANHPLLVRSRVTDADLDFLAGELHKLGHFGTQCSLQQVYKEISKFSDWDIHNVCLDHQKRLGRWACVYVCMCMASRGTCMVFSYGHLYVCACLCSVCIMWLRTNE